MKKILFLTTALVSFSVQANDTNYFENNSNPQPENNIGVVDDPDPSAPIDDYIYVLTGLAVGFGIYYNRKSILNTKS